MRQVVPKLSEHGGEIVLLGIIGVGVIGAMVLGMLNAKSFDPAAYLVVETMIISAIKERWTQRSVDRMGASLANSPPTEPPAPSPDGATKET